MLLHTNVILFTHRSDTTYKYLPSGNTYAARGLLLLSRDEHRISHSLHSIHCVTYTAATEPGMLPSPLLLRFTATRTALRVAPVLYLHDAAASPSPVALATITATTRPVLAAISARRGVARCRALPLMLHHHALAPESRVGPGTSLAALASVPRCQYDPALHPPAPDLPL